MDAVERWSPNTRRAYAADWRSFEQWALARQMSPLAGDVAAVAAYLSEQADRYSWSTVLRRRAAIARAHLAEGLPDPTAPLKTTEEWDALRRRVASRGRRPSAPMTVALLVDSLSLLPRGLQGARDRAVLLVAFAGAFRRSELVGLNVGDLERRRPDGYRAPAGSRSVRIVRGTGPTCPVRAIDQWIDAAHLDADDGALFRRISRTGSVGERLTASTANVIVKRAVGRAGGDPSGYSARSLRTGFVHAALAAGVPPGTVARQAGLEASTAKDLPFTSRHLKAMGL